MSWQAALLNGWLRIVEKPSLRRARDPVDLRRRFEFQARLAFHGPGGVTREWSELAGGQALWVRPRERTKPPTILYFHGGAHMMGSPRTHAAMMSVLAKRVGAVAVLPRYPLAPEHPFPAALEHCIATYHALMEDDVDPGRLVIGGDSAGGNLVFALLAELLAVGAPLPAGVFAMSPLTDLTFSGDSIATNARSEVLLPVERLADMRDYYLGFHPADDPRVSPLFADFTGAPPVWLTASDTEILRDDTLRMADHLRAQGSAVALTVVYDLPHVWPLFHNVLPEARATLDDLAAWIGNQTGASAATR